MVVEWVRPLVINMDEYNSTVARVISTNRDRSGMLINRGSMHMHMYTRIVRATTIYIWT